jgi:FkbM family methyltransferase
VPEITAIERNARYDQQTVDVMKRVMTDESTGIDVGAHCGSVLAEMLAIAPRGEHFAFEPLPHMARALRERFPGVSVHECALSDTHGMSTFEYVTNDPGYSGLRRREYDRADPAIAQITVATERLDDVIPDRVRVDFIKVDVEGGEYHALAGGIDMLLRCRPTIVFEAAARSTGLYGVTPDDFHRFFTDRCGMSVSTMERWLEGRMPYALDEFGANWWAGAEFYFIAYPTR